MHPAVTMASTWFTYCGQYSTHVWAVLTCGKPADCQCCFFCTIFFLIYLFCFSCSCLYVYFLLFVLSFFVSTSAVYSLERLVTKMTHCSTLLVDCSFENWGSQVLISVYLVTLCFCNSFSALNFDVVILVTGNALILWKVLLPQFPEKLVLWELT